MGTEKLRAMGKRMHGESNGSNSNNNTIDSGNGMKKKINACNKIIRKLRTIDNGLWHQTEIYKVKSEKCISYLHNEQKYINLTIFDDRMRCEWNMCVCIARVWEENEWNTVYNSKMNCSHWYENIFDNVYMELMISLCFSSVVSSPPSSMSFYLE